tara:strand:+ start:318 stop:872 length:555 start_codon:yes stop_codon:yes gene_type:complete
MFQRRKKQNLTNKVFEWAWPRGGWRRMIHYIYLRMARMKGTPYSIAAGFACGAAVSFTPLIGVHFLLAGLLSWLIRANVIVSLIGTIVGNPWTFPFIWIWTYKIGNWIISPKVHIEKETAPDFYSSFNMLIESFLQFNKSLIIESAIPVLWPMLVGSIPTAFVVWFLSFVLVRKGIESYQGNKQ